MRLCGVGETPATAPVAMVGNAHKFRCGRQLSAWLGLVPGQYSSGGKTRLGRFTKAGDAYLRSLLIMGARAPLHAAKDKSDGVSRWAVALAERRGYWRAVVAIAAKNARMAWAVLRRGEQFGMPSRIATGKAASAPSAPVPSVRAVRMACGPLLSRNQCTSRSTQGDTAELCEYRTSGSLGLAR